MGFKARAEYLPPEELADITGRMQDSADDISRLARKLGEA